MSHSYKLIISSLIICFALGVGLGALAQEDATTETNGEEMEEVVEDEAVKPEDLDNKEPKILPGSWFYFLKEWGRGIRSFFAFGRVKKSEVESEIANERVLELKKMVEEGESSKKIEEAIAKYEKTMEKLRARAEKIKETAEEDTEVESFLDKFTKHQLLHQKILQKLESQVPEEIFQKINQARERHLEKFGEVMTKLENREEKIKERIEEALEEEGGSRFKNFKNLERLIEIEEKIPEQAKEAIRQAQENALKRLKGDLERMSSEDQERFKEYLDKIFGDKEIQTQILEKLKERIQNREELQQRLMDAQQGILERIQIREREQEQTNTGACITLWSPVCGKDGKTYSNECFARQAGVEVDYKGRCKSEIEARKCIKQGTNIGLILEEAKRIALNSECAEKGRLAETGNCNTVTGTWWINLDVFEKRGGCNPACVVDVIDKTAEINWRCTGLIPPE